MGEKHPTSAPKGKKIEPSFKAVEVTGKNDAVPLESFVRSLIFWALEDGIIPEFERDEDGE